MLNTICGWDFIKDWNDNEYEYPIGKAVVFNDKIINEAKQLKKEILSGTNNEHKKLVSSFLNSLQVLVKGDTFFIYRVTHKYPTQRLLFKIVNELTYIKIGKSKEQADSWFNDKAATFFNEYDIRYYWHCKQGEVERSKRVCRFCGGCMPDVKFEKIAHAIPESIGGHKNLICHEECDDCNKTFGAGIERNLCEWFDFRRSKEQVKKKSGGVPKAYGRNYIIENNKISIFSDGHSDVLIKAVGSGTVTLQGIYRALCKIALNLIDKKHLELLRTTIEWIRFGKPKSSKYPNIAQMTGLSNSKEPCLYICTRYDGIDNDKTPLHICILRIFDLAFLYTLPHIDGRMQFSDEYTKNIPLDALKVLGFNNEWTWEAYNSTEARNPHVLLDTRKAQITHLKDADETLFNKLRIEKKPKDYIDFPEPVLNKTDIINRHLEKVDYTHTKDIVYATGKVTTKAIVDLNKKAPLFIKLEISYSDVRTGKVFSTVIYSVQIDPKVYNKQLLIYDDDSLCFNQDLLAVGIKMALDYLYEDIILQYRDYPFTQEGLEINNTRELLKDTDLFFMKNGCFIDVFKGEKIWHTGY